MPNLSDVEKDYIGLKIIVGDNQQERELQINPTWNIVNWLKVRNMMRDGNELLEGTTLYLEDPTGGYLTTKRYIESKLESNGIEFKDTNDWK